MGGARSRSAKEKAARADLIEWQYNGQVGPANVSDVEYRFFAPGVGPVAAIDRQSVSAFLILT